MIVPISRSSLQSLKAETDEKNRLINIENFTKVLYENAIKQASTSTESIYRFEIGVFHPGVTSTFVNDNKDDILRILQKLFPDSIVEYKKLIKHIQAMRKGGYVPPVYYDISTVDQHILPLMTGNIIVDCIVVDWS